MDNNLTIPLKVVLQSWERHNQVLLNLLQLIPEVGLSARATPTSPTVSAMFSHLHHERVVSVRENAPEMAAGSSPPEWALVSDKAVLAAQMVESECLVRRAVECRCAEGRTLDQSFPHPVYLLQFLIFHESYHHGQIKLALKVSDLPLDDEVVGPVIWDLWRARDLSLPS